MTIVAQRHSVCKHNRLSVHFPLSSNKVTRGVRFCQKTRKTTKDGKWGTECDLAVSSYGPTVLNARNNAGASKMRDIA